MDHQAIIPTECVYLQNPSVDDQQHLQLLKQHTNSLDSRNVPLHKGIHEVGHQKPFMSDRGLQSHSQVFLTCRIEEPPQITMMQALKDMKELNCSGEDGSFQQTAIFYATAFE